MSRQLERVKGVTGIFVRILLMLVLTVQFARGEDNPVVARIGETVITLSQVRGQMKQTLNVKHRPSTQQLYVLLDDMITGILFSKEAVEQGLDKEPENMAALKGVSEDKRVDILVKSYKNKFLTVPRATDQEASDYYVNNLGLYNTPKIYNGFMFSVAPKAPNNSDPKDNDKECTGTCKEAAQAIYDRLIANAKDYETVVKLKDEFAEKHPELDIFFALLSHWEGKVKNSAYDNALKEFMQLQPGQVKIIEAKGMHVIINLAGVYDPPIYKFEEVKNRVISDIERKKSVEKQNEAIKKLAEKYKLQVYPKYIEQLADEQIGGQTK
ncbi:Peptidyl-prolyl cis-trans isomerase ppiD [Candidatus Magnetobacterium bavaricum]|uniref:Peptidyl-prolyl cis-trans isomerase ppiD n=1 Tax=Candidatus Magnetobacterium bavaricum TaxID=29290 RepID=A0A0F3GXA7_9BACT|nr:Peptidyl-prolyl cis-trans isomerase ppiD [Candidatus Magnetobacterium bavaricum]